jgi:MFS family permease
LKPSSSSIYPAGATNANWFSLLNAISFQITLGSPMILYAKSLGATATVLGVIAAMTPLLTIAQIPAAHFLGRIGYRRFILMGWGSRTLFIFLIALVPMLSFLNDLGRIALVLFALFAFNLVRGISSGAWLPWLSDLIPEDLRGRFLSRDQVFLHFGSLAALLTSAVVLSHHPEPWRFTAIFLLSAIGGVTSLRFLNRIPDIEAQETLVRSNMRVPWKEIVAYPPFLRLVIFHVLFVFTMGSLGVFTVAFLKTKIGYDESRILYLSAVYFIGALITLPVVGRLLDRTGSKLILQLSLGVFSAIVLVWALIAAGICGPSLVLIAALHFISGVAGPNFGLASVRLVMNTMPPMGRSHFFAFFTVITSLGLALSPLLWGISLDAIGERHAAWGAVRLDKFALFYLSIFVLVIVTLLYAGFLHEKASGLRRVDVRDAVFRANLKRLWRFWQR